MSRNPPPKYPPLVQPPRSELDKTKSDSAISVKSGTSGTSACTVRYLPKNCDYNFKIVLLGGPQVGKSSILRRYIDGVYMEKQPPKQTMGAYFKSKLIKHESSGMRVKLDIWDTAGDEKFNSMTNFYFREAHGIMLVYDITSPQSLKDMDFWFQSILDNGNSLEKKMLLGNKLDMEENRAVEKLEGIRLATRNYMEYSEVSAKDGTGVNEIFDCLIEMMIEESINNEDYKRIGMNTRIDLNHSSSFRLSAATPSFIRRSQGAKEKKCCRNCMC